MFVRGLSRGVNHDQMLISQMGELETTRNTISKITKWTNKKNNILASSILLHSRFRTHWTRITFFFCGIGRSCIRIQYASGACCFLRLFRRFRCWWSTRWIFSWLTRRSNCGRSWIKIQHLSNSRFPRTELVLFGGIQLWQNFQRRIITNTAIKEVTKKGCKNL